MFVPHRKHMTSPLRAEHVNSIWRFSVPHRKHNTSPLKAQQVNVIYRSVTMVYWYNCQVLDIIHRPIFCLNTLWIMFVPHRKHITSPLRAQQVNAIHRLLAMVYYYQYHISWHYTSACLLYKIQRYRAWILSRSSDGKYIFPLNRYGHRN
jgi:hypothetical protein